MADIQIRLEEETFENDPPPPPRGPSKETEFVVMAIGGAIIAIAVIALLRLTFS